jgi:hypothetical protein
MSVKLFFAILLLNISPFLFGQINTTINISNKNNDSSFYSICQINNNEFWIGGENGILFQCDSNANLSRSNLNTEGCTILKMVKQDPFVFMITDSQVIFRYHLPSSKLEKFTMAGFRKKCFYDIALLPNGKIMLCGGNKQVARVKKCIPYGFIAETDTGLHQIKTTWKNARKFVWSLAYEKNIIYASTFNGFNSKIIQKKINEKWKSKTKLKGIAYQIYADDNGISALGAENMKFRKNGILHEQTNTQIIHSSGCIWNRKCDDQKKYFVSNNGDLIRQDKSKNTIEKTTLLKGISFYDLEKIASNKWMIVGHGKTIIFRELN